MPFVHQTTCDNSGLVNVINTTISKLEYARDNSKNMLKAVKFASHYLKTSLKNQTYDFADSDGNCPQKEYHYENLMIKQIQKVSQSQLYDSMPTSFKSMVRQDSRFLPLFSLIALSPLPPSTHFQTSIFNHKIWLLFRENR